MKPITNLNGEAVHLDDEATYRKKLYLMARTLGCEGELTQFFAKYDGIINRCTNQQEKKAMATMAIIELNNLFNGSTSVGFGGSLTINKEAVIEIPAITQDKEKANGLG